MAPDSLARQIRTLSMGVLSTLTGIFRYDELEEIQEDFVKWSEKHAPHAENWQTAWGLYQRRKE